MFKNGNVTLMVSNLERAVAFYSQTLGLKLQGIVPGHWAQVEGTGLTIGLHPAAADGLPSAKPESPSIGFEVDDLNAAMATLRARGLQFGPLIDEKATLIAPFSDPDGYPLYLVQVKQGAWDPT